MDYGVYGSWTLKQLKEELKKRGARFLGRKRDLIDRLEFYDRHNNLGQDTTHITEGYQMSLPHIQQYKDINSQTKLPRVPFINYGTYLAQSNKSHNIHIENLYKEKFIICIRHAEDSKHFIKARVAAEMKKKITYNVDLSIDNNGVICEAQCDCGAGMGPEAHCKHVCVVIYGLTDFSSKGSINVQVTCTDTLQSFHQAKKFKGSPIKSENFSLSRKPKTANTIAAIASRDPRPARYRNMSNYDTYFRNISLNYSYLGNDMPICQLYKPANLYAVAHDHEYCELSPEDIFLQNKQISYISERSIEDIEINTRGQSTNRRWFHERQWRITSSNFGRICRASPLTNLDKLARDMLKTHEIKSKSLDHGRLYERVAIRKYEELTGNECNECGMVVSKEYPFLASSPDGLVDDDLLVEVKCPYSARNLQINAATLSYVHDTNGLQLNKDHFYYYQVQGQMLCTGRTKCDFVIYTFIDTKVIRIEKDEEVIADMLRSLKSFYESHFKKAILDRFFYRNYKCYNF